MTPEFKGFQVYKSKPITRLAYQLQGGDTLEVIDETTREIVIHSKPLRFKCYEPPRAGDYIVYLNDEDIYHCSEEVFKERNEV